MSVRVNLVAGLALVPLIGAGNAIAAPTQNSPPGTPAAPARVAPAKGATASLALDVAALKPGTSATLAIAFDIAPRWHIYWDGINDTGQAPKITARELPQGVTLGEIQWPAPARHVEPGDIVDHIYETRAVLLVPVTLAKDVKVGEKLSIGLSIDWMECASECRMGSAKLETSLFAADETKPSPQAKAIAAAQAQVPKAPSPKDGVTAVMERGVLKIAASDAEAIAFFPAHDSAVPRDRVAGCEGKGPRLEVAMEEPATRWARGIVSVRKGKETKYFTIQTPAATSTKRDEPAGARKAEPK
ncbi:MAG: protein-disulfide reductase DsbD N-terminal domain-containing protein [Planctomycetota bacterium]